MNIQEMIGALRQQRLPPQGADPETLRMIMSQSQNVPQDAPRLPSFAPQPDLARMGINTAPQPFQAPQQPDQLRQGLLGAGYVGNALMDRVRGAGDWLKENVSPPQPSAYGPPVQETEDTPLEQRRENQEPMVSGMRDLLALVRGFSPDNIAEGSQENLDHYFGSLEGTQPSIFNEEKPQFGMERLLGVFPDFGPAAAGGIASKFVGPVGDVVLGANVGGRVKGKPSKLIDRVKTPRRDGKITKFTELPEVRDMEMADAIFEARRQNHVIPNKAGGYIGAPSHVQGKGALKKQRANIDRLVEIGSMVDAKGQHGGTWYPRTKAGINELTGGDPVRSRTTSQVLGATSPLANPRSNLGFTLDASNAHFSGKPVDIVRTGQVGDAVNATLRGADESLDAMRVGQNPMLGHNRGPALNPITPEMAKGMVPAAAKGRKTGPYAADIDPAVNISSMGVNDTWAARTHGYTQEDGSIWIGSVTANMHKWMDRENLLAAHRANERALGGKTDWTPQEIQSAAWVAEKGQALAKQKGISLEEGLALANRTYADEMDHFAASMTAEGVPYADAGGLGDVVKNMSLKERDAWSKNAEWIDSTGQHPLFKEMGMLQGNVQRSRGQYTPPSGVPESNTVTTSRPLTRLVRQDDTQPRRMHPDDSEAMDTVSMIDQTIRQQGSSPIHRVESPLSGGGRQGNRRDVLINLGRGATDEDIAKARSIVEKHGGMISNTHDGLVIFGLDDFGASGKTTGKALKGQLGKDIEEAFGVQGQRAEMQSNYDRTNFETEMSAENAGQGQVTDRLLAQVQKNAKVNPRSGAALYDSPAIKDEAAKWVDMIMRHGAGRTRPDILKTLKILSMGGLRALEEYVKKNGSGGLMGIAGLAAAGYPLMPGLGGGETDAPVNYPPDAI